MPDLRLINSDVLKLRRRYGMLAVCAGLTLGILLLAFVVITLPARRAPCDEPARRRAQGLHRQPPDHVPDGVPGRRDRRRHRRRAGPRHRRVPRSCRHRPVADRALPVARRRRLGLVTVLVAITLAVDFAGAFVLADGTSTPHLGDLGTRSRWCSHRVCSARRWPSGSPRWSARAGR
jgi:hypothetical protein